MKKDIFIDNNIANKFTNPQDEEYIKLTTWLLHYNSNDISNKDNYAHLVVSKKLLGEYYRSNFNSFGGTSIPVIIDKLTRDGRLVQISNEDIKIFQSKFYTKFVLKKLKDRKSVV